MQLLDILCKLSPSYFTQNHYFQQFIGCYLPLQ